MGRLVYPVFPALTPITRITRMTPTALIGFRERTCHRASRGGPDQNPQTQTAGDQVLLVFVDSDRALAPAERPARQVLVVVDSVGIRGIREIRVLAFLPALRTPGGLRAVGAAPVGQELRDESVLLTRGDGKRRECERDGQGGVIAGRSRRRRALERGMRLVDPDRAILQASELGIARARLELHEQAVAAGTSASGN